MDKKRKNENDEISQLLDSFQMDEEDTLEQKMDQFKKTQNRSRVKKHKPEPEIPFQSKKVEPSLGDTFVVGSKDLNEPESKEDLSATRTVMWNADELKQEADATNKTVVIDDDEIQSLLEEGKGPQLKREVINKKKDSKKKASKKNNSKTGLYIGLGIVGVLLISLLIFGGIKLVTSGLSGSDEKTEEVQKKNYQELLDFANNYDSLSSSEKKGIVDLESKYNSLTRKQREKIDEILEKATGKNFNELLAKANKKTNSKKKNNNTEIAEKKAELRKKISDLKDQLSKAKADLESAQKAQESAQSDVDSLTSKINSANSSLKDAQSAVNSAQSEYDNLVSILKRRAELDNIPNDQISQDELSELSDIRTNHPNLENEVNSAKDDLDAANAALSTAQKNSNVSSLENKLSTAQTKLDSAGSDVKDAQSKVDSLNSQINDYQSQLDDLD
ncbi:hypothetical protein [uncultured Holdemanella sp.]|uniref:hypothetical protein n=1 Tax=uncultured Holdemanella sp. TaxID=1763549 RepID=UPI0025FFB9F5|nr:hypothetical protein [uncultured Holdemanella sp.]